MQTHERGASRVPLLAFLSVLVLLLGAAFMAYQLWNQKKASDNALLAAQNDRDTAIAKEEIRRHLKEDVGNLLGETGTYTGRPDTNYAVDGEMVASDSEAIKAIGVSAAPMPGKLKELMDKFATDAGIQPKSGGSGLAPLFSAAVDEITSLRSRVQTLTDAQGDLNTQISNEKTAKDEVEREASRKQSDLSSEMRRKDDEFSSTLRNKDETISAANAEYTTLSERLAERTADHQRQTADLRRQIETLQARIDAAANKTRLINPAQQPDGMVLEALQAAGAAWINLGRRDMLPIGTAFEIIKRSTGEVKGTGVVSRVEQNRAELRITSLVDRFEPIQKGDQVRNDLFSANMSHNIYLMGSFRAPYNEPLLRTLLENLGNRVADRLSPSVDLVLVGDDPINEDGSGFTPIESTPEYQKAMFLRLEMAPLSRMRSFLKLSDNDGLR